MIAVDGTELGALLDLVGAPAAPTAAARARVAELERQLGRPLPGETRELLSRLPRLEDPDAAGHPEIDELDFFGGLPDVEAFLDRLATELEGPFLAACQFYGLVPVSVRIDRGDFTYAMAAIDAYRGDRLGGVFYYDEHELGPLAATASAFVAAELTAYRRAARSGDLYDCYRLDHDPSAAIEPFAEVPEPIAAAFADHARQRSGGRERWWICAALRGEIADWALDALPTPERWALERDRVDRLHGDAVYWLLAHAILGNRRELAEAIDRSRSNPSRLVAAVRDFVAADPGFVDRHRELREELYELARGREL